MITTIYCGEKDSLFLRPAMRLGQWKCNHFQHIQIHPYLYSPSTMEIYQQKPQQTTQWFASTNNQEEITIMLDSATTCSTIPSDSYPIERKTKINFRLFQARLPSMQKKNKSVMDRIHTTTRWLDKTTHPQSYLSSRGRIIATTPYTTNKFDHCHGWIKIWNKKWRQPDHSSWQWNTYCHRTQSKFWTGK